MHFCQPSHLFSDRFREKSIDDRLLFIGRHEIVMRDWFIGEVNNG